MTSHVGRGLRLRLIRLSLRPLVHPASHCCAATQPLTRVPASTSFRVSSIDLAPRLRLNALGTGEFFMRNLGIVALCAALGGRVSTGEAISFRASNPNHRTRAAADRSGRRREVVHARH